MFTIHSDSAGKVISIWQGEGFTRTDPEPPEKAAVSINIDEWTNSELRYAILANREAYTIEDSVLIGPTGPVIIQAPNREYIAFWLVEDSEELVRNIPGWARWTQTEALEWFGENIADPLGAVPDVDGLTATQYRANAQDIDAQWQDIITAQAAAIRGLTRLVLAMRNKLWPKLEGSE